jgi:DNA-binding transcriptional LysR family regulator
MEWDDLKHFLEVARHGSLSKAALALRTTPATVGRRVAALESKLGARLFDRRHSGYSLTERGDAIRSKAEEAEEAILALQRETLHNDPRAVGTVRVTTTDDIAALVLAPHLAQFTKRFPDISLDIAADREVINLARREADIGFRTVRPARGGLVVRQAGWWRLGLYAAKSYAEARNLRPGLADLSSVDIITWTKEHAHLRGGPWFAEHARNSRVVLTASSRRIHHAACKAGIGVAVLPTLLADRDPDLVCLLPSDRVIAAKLWLVVHRDLAGTARVRSVMDFIAKVAPK